ncbi:putative DNA-directed RNA polymerase [Medicago truncatula]|uniref:Putative DNA-directed RNA polymerase n=1 Tax=Medicago truncatula TaxID=3880 RepID=A0A396JJV1_MEDTR|nr:putative DNA-directed RNA polymerase [Medicago truncatula]
MQLCRKLIRDVRGYTQKVCSLTRDVRGYAQKFVDNGKEKTITYGLKYSLTTYNLGKSNDADTRAGVSHILKTQSGNPHIPFLLFFVTLLFLSPTMAEIISVAINSDTQPIVSLRKFVFTIRGCISISVSSVTVLSSSAQPTSSCFGFFLANDEGYRLAKMEIQKNPNLCFLNSRFIYRLFTFRDLFPPPLSSFNYSFPVFAPNQYTLFFVVCLCETSVSMLVRTELFNINSDGGKDYLSAEQTRLPLVLLLFFLAYVAIDIMCCGAIMCVVFLSISFLETSRTDGKTVSGKVDHF